MNNKDEVNVKFNDEIFIITMDVIEECLEDAIDKIEIIDLKPLKEIL